MRRVPVASRDLARRLLVLETGGRQEGEALAAAVEQALARLYEHMSALIGPAGFHALLARALHLAKGEFPLLERVSSVSDPDPFLNLIREAIEGREVAEATDALAAVLGGFIWLLGTFIGDDLALRLVRETWPEVSWNEQGLGKQETRK